MNVHDPHARPHDDAVESRPGGASRLRGIAGSGWLWLAVMVAGSGALVLSMSRHERPAPPPTYAKVPDFELTDQLGRPFTGMDMDGHVSVVNFIFTSCPTRCPPLSEAMSNLQHKLRPLKDRLHLLSFSVDPERDTPEVLKKYGDKYGANPERWRFLTGEYAAMEKAVVRGFKLPMQPSNAPEHEDHSQHQAAKRHDDGEHADHADHGPDGDDDLSLFSITHGTRFVLVDHNRQIRGYYEMDDAGLGALIRDIQLIVSQEMARDPIPQS